MSRQGTVFKMALSQRANLLGFTGQPTQKKIEVVEFMAEDKLSMKL